MPLNKHTFSYRESDYVQIPASQADLSQGTLVQDVQEALLFSVDPANGGAFALTFGIIGGKERLAAVDDNTASLDIWTIPAPAYASDAAADNSQSTKRTTVATNAYFATYYSRN